MDDNQIIEMYISRNQKAVEETNNKYGKYCRSVAYNFLKNKEDVSEAVNDTYLGAWNSIPPNIPERLSVFLGKITRNICLNMLRSKNARRRGSSESEIIFEEVSECICSGANAPARIEAKELAVFIDTFLSQLPETERRVFVRRYWHFDSLEKISVQYGFSISKVKSMLFRIRRKLQKEMRKENLI